MEVTAAATFCATVVDEWAEAGVSDAVVCPGSRSTPMAMALADDPRINVHVAIDERSGAFCALGIAIAGGRPAPVLTTSGTATANIFPAVVEADEAAVPFIVCTADRPPELHGVGAPQATDQQNLYGAHARIFIDAGVPDWVDRSAWRPVARRVLEASFGGRQGPPGPVQFNLPFREPLTGRTGELPPRVGPPHRPARAPSDDVDVRAIADDWQGRRGVMVAGPGVDDPDAVVHLAEVLGWPVLADPISGCRTWSPATVSRFDALLRASAVVPTPEVVVRFGGLPASKVLGEWLATMKAEQIAIDAHGRRFDPHRTLDTLWQASPGVLSRRVASAVDPGASPSRWLARWAELDELADAAVAGGLGDDLTEPGIARAVVAGVGPGDLVVSSSMPIRDVEWYGGRQEWVRVIANRGVNGIDGVISTAAGVALRNRQLRRRHGLRLPTVVLLGDLAFLHDSNGLLGVTDRDIDLILVVTDNGGGGIFGFLPQHELLGRERYEQLFGTPHGLDLVAIGRAFGVPARAVDSITDLRQGLGDAIAGGGVHLLVARTDREKNVAVHADLHDRVARAVTRSRPE